MQNVDILQNIIGSKKKHSSNFLIYTCKSEIKATSVRCLVHIVREGKEGNCEPRCR